MNLRSREVYIITAVIVAVVAAAWFFLFFKPLLHNLNSTSAQINQDQRGLTAAKADVVRLEGFRKTAPQTESDLLRLNKMMPSESGIPSVIIEITQTAQQSGLDFVSIQPGGVASGTPFGVETINLSFTGRYYDLEDFLFRLESYVEYLNGTFTVTGRLLQVTQIELASGPAPGFPNLAITLTVDAYLWTAPQVFTGGVPPTPSVSASPTTSPSPSVTSSTSPSPSASPSTSASPSPSLSGSASPTPTATGSTAP